MKVNAKQFLDAALPALKYADANPIIFITGAVLISPVENDSTRVTITACNSQGSLKCTAPVLFPPINPVCLMGADLLKILKVFSGETTITVKENMAEIKCGSSKYDVPVMPSKDFPKTGNYADEIALEISSSDLKEVLSILNALSSHYDMRPGASGIFFFDGIALAWDAEDKSMGATHIVHGIEKPFVIPHRAIPHLIDAIGKSDANEICSICVNEEYYLTIGIGDTVFNVVPNSGNPDIPTFRQFIPFIEKQPAIYFDIDPDAFKSALIQASIFGSTYIRIDFDDSNVIVSSHEISMESGAFNKHSRALCPFISICLDGKTELNVPPYHFASRKIISGIGKMDGEMRVKVFSNGTLLSTNHDKSIMFFCQQTVFNNK